MTIILPQLFIPRVGFISRTERTSSGNYNVPANASWLYVKMWAGGGAASIAPGVGNRGGSGAFCKVLIPVTPSEILTLSPQSGGVGGGGSNPAGNGGQGIGLLRSSIPLVIAGGGGGGCANGSVGFRGGFPNGIGSSGSNGGGGTQSAGGTAGFSGGVNSVSGNTGSYLQGGNGGTPALGTGLSGGGGGGGGYYGGGGGGGGGLGSVAGAGGGGSSFSDGANDNIFMSNGLHGGNTNTLPTEATSDVDYVASGSSSQAATGEGGIGDSSGSTQYIGGRWYAVIYAYGAKPLQSTLP